MILEAHSARSFFPKPSRVTPLMPLEISQGNVDYVCACADAIEALSDEVILGRAVESAINARPWDAVRVLQFFASDSGKASSPAEPSTIPAIPLSVCSHLNLCMLVLSARALRCVRAQALMLQLSSRVDKLSTPKRWTERSAKPAHPP